jgi:phosphoglycolate phosphatase-like HAD superfamily hydrolase
VTTGRLNLVLWDIDHTLIETRGVGKELYERAFKRVTGQALTHHIEITGRTELAIATDALRRHGLEPIDQLLAAYCAELVLQYRTHSNDLRQRGRALPGAGDALSALAALAGTVQTVLTGNLREVAAIKLESFGLGEHIDLEIGAYAEDDPERSRLVAVAQERAGLTYGTTFDRGNTMLIGDTVHDVTAAHEGGARVVAVASGRDPLETLRTARPDAALTSLADTDRVVQTVRAAQLSADCAGRVDKTGS